VAFRPPTIENVRERFSALGVPVAFFDGPGGTQAPDSVVEAISSYLQAANANVGGAWVHSLMTGEVVNAARQAASHMLGGETDEFVFGANTTTLNFALSRTAGREWEAGDEVVVTRLDHDANVAPWLELAHDRGLVVLFCELDGECRLDLDHLRSLERGSLDVAFTLLPLPPGSFHTRAVLLDPWVLVAQAGSRLAAAPRPTLDLETVGRLPLVTFRAPRSIDDALDRFREAGVDPNFVLRSDYNDAVQEFAAAGRGVALMPRLAVNARDERTAIVELDGLIPPREIALAWHADRAGSEQLETFVALAAELCSGLAESPTALRASAASEHGAPLRRAGTAGARGGA